MKRLALGAAVVGVAGGAATVVATLSLELVARGLPVRGGLLVLQRESVAIWVLESLPFVIGAAAYTFAARAPELVPIPQPLRELPPPPPAPAPAVPKPPPSSGLPVSFGPPPPVPATLQATNLLALGNEPPATAAKVRALEGQLKAVKEQAERSANQSRAKSRYLAEMQHELRTPLNAIVGYAELLHDEAQGRGLAMTGDLEKIAQAGRRLVGLVDDLLDLAKIEVGQLQVVLSDVDLAQVCEEIRGPASVLAEVERNTYAVRFGRGARLVRADHMRVRQVLMALLGNAFRSTRRGKVQLVIERDSIKVDAWVALRVRDDGPPLTPAQQAAAFDDWSIVEDRSGTGIGLAIARKLVELMGGRITVASDAGGNVFSVLLPPAQTSEEQVSPRSTVALNERLAGLSLLLLDAGPGGVTLGRYLERAGLTVRVVADVALARVACDGGAPDLVIADAGLEGAWAFVEDLVTDGAKVVVTSLRDGDVEQALRLGVTAFLVRPLERRLVLATLERCL